MIMRHSLNNPIATHLSSVLHVQISGNQHLHVDYVSQTLLKTAGTDPPSSQTLNANWPTELRVGILSGFEVQAVTSIAHLAVANLHNDTLAEWLTRTFCSVLNLPDKILTQHRRAC